MKRILLAFVLILCFGSTSFASETNDNVKSDYCTNGHIYINYVGNVVGTLQTDTYMYYSNHDITVNDGYIYILEYQQPSGEYVDYSYFICGKGSANVLSVIQEEREDGTFNTREYNNTFNLCSGDSYLRSLCSVQILSGTLPANTKYYYDRLLYDTDIPIFNFEDTESWKAYEETGDTSGSLNGGYDDNYDETIPMPHGLKVLKGTDQSLSGNKNELITVYHHDIVLSWNQSDVIDNLQYEIEGQFYYERLSDSDMTQIQEMKTPYKVLVNKTAYDNTDSMSVVINKATLNGYAERGYQTKLVLRVRNVVGNNTSNWVSVTINLRDRSATANEENYDDNSDTGGDEYNDTNVDANNSSPTDLSLDSIQEYISGGFGLLGSGGIISLMSQTFLYLPGSLWDIMKFYISMIVVVALFAFIIKVVF